MRLVLACVCLAVAAAEQVKIGDLTTKLHAVSGEVGITTGLGWTV